MNRAATILAGLAIAATGFSVADAQTYRTAARVRAHTAPVHAPAAVLDLTTSTNFAMDAAKASKAKTVETQPDATVEPVIVRPEARREGRVVASTDAYPLTSPYFSAKDAQDPPLAISLGGNSTLGRQRFDNRPRLGGLLANNPELTGNPTRSDIGVTTQF